MMRKPLDDRGAGAVEFALAAPVFFSMVIGISQLGLLFIANAGLKHSVDDAARAASVYPLPADSDIAAALQDSRFGMKGTLTPVIAHPTANVVDITLNYSVPLNFVFFRTSPVTLSHSRRVFVQTDPSTTVNPGGTAPTPTSSASSASTSSTSTTSASSASTSAGGTTSTTGGTTSTTGGTTSTTGGTTSTTGSTTTTSTGATTPSSNGNSNGNNASSGNGNNGSNGNSNGNNNH